MRRYLRYARFVVASLLALSGVCLTIAFSAAGWTLSIPMALTLLAVVSLVGMWVCAATPLSLLPRLLILLYILPFSICVGYLTNPNFTWPLSDNVLAVNYQVDLVLIRQMLSVGVIGLLGMTAGMGLAGAILRPSPIAESEKPHKTNTLGPVLFLAGLAASFALSWYNAPKETIFETTVLDQSRAAALSVNFNGAWLASYLILILLWIDAERDRWHGRGAKWKFISIIAVSLYIAVVFELLRGDREIVALIAALGGLFLTMHARRLRAVFAARVERRRLVLLAGPMAALMTVVIAIGAIRAQYGGVKTWERPEFGQMVMDGMRSSTWTGVLYTDLSMSGRYRHRTLRYLYGKTYVDYLLSLPPGVVAYYLGYKRPMDLEQPAEWAYDVGSGGTYVTNVPMANFGPPGVFVILAISGALGVWWEILGREQRFWSRLLYGTALATSFHWFWYGEMNLIRGLVGASLMYFAYWLATDVQWLDFRHWRPSYAHRN